MPETRDALCAAGDDCAILFARTPIPGRVKSRLWTHLTQETACRLHRAATNDSITLLHRALPTARKWLFLSEAPVSGDAGENTARWGLNLPPGFGCAVQEGSDLGERMGAAFQRAFESGARRVVIFGSDSPTLPAEVVREAFCQLDGNELALGPTDDGGYYLIGCCRFDPGLFQGVEWSTAGVFTQTQANAGRLGYRTAVLRRWFDLDEWKDVERLMEEARRGTAVPAELAALLREFERYRQKSF